MAVLVAAGKMFEDKDDPRSYVHEGVNDIQVPGKTHRSNSGKTFG